MAQYPGTEILLCYLNPEGRCLGGNGTPKALPITCSLGPFFSKLALRREQSTTGRRRTPPSECHSGPRARQLASSPRQSKAGDAQTKGQMKTDGEQGDFSLSLSFSQAQGLKALVEGLQIKIWELSSVQIPSFLPFFFKFF